MRRAAAPVVDTALLDATVGNVAQALYAEGTLRPYRSHVADYLRFCAAIDAPRDAGCPPGVPVSFSTLVRFCVWYVALKPNRAPYVGLPHAASTLHSKISALKAAASKDAWAWTPTNALTFGGVPGYALTEAENRTLVGIVRALAKIYPTGDRCRKLPMRLAFLVRIWDWYDRAPSWARSRDRVWQAIGHQGLLRVGELVKLRAANVRLIRDAAGVVVAVQIELVGAKTADYTDEATGGRQFVTIASRPDACDAVGPLLAWMRGRGTLTDANELVAGRGGDLLFPAAEDGLEAIPKEYVATTLREGLAGIGLDPSFIASYSGRSLRAGGATDMRDSGVEWHVIVMQGRWRSDAWKVYFRESADILEHLLRLRPVALDAIRQLAPASLAAADADGRARERLPALPAPRPVPSAALEQRAATERLAMEALARADDAARRDTFSDAEWTAAAASVVAASAAANGARAANAAAAETLSLMSAAALMATAGGPADVRAVRAAIAAAIGGETAAPGQHAGPDGSASGAAAGRDAQVAPLALRASARPRATGWSRHG